MPTLSAVSLRPDPYAPARVVVTPVWSGVDRPSSLSWSTPHNLVQRLVRAILDGVAVRNPHVLKDVYGKTYVMHDHVISGVELEADLTANGF